MRRTASILLLVAGIAAYLSAGAAGQGDSKPTNDLPNPYQGVPNYFKMPAGRTWGSTSAVEIDKDGRSIWVAERCGANSCLDATTVDTILKFDPSGKLVKSFGAYTESQQHLTAALLTTHESNLLLHRAQVAMLDELRAMRARQKEVA